MTASKMTVNGVSVCATGQENYERFEARRGKCFYQYDYRHTDGELFSIVLPTLTECRMRRDKWLSDKNNTAKIKNINTMTATEIRQIKYEDCKLCKNVDMCGKMTVNECKERISANTKR